MKGPSLNTSRARVGLAVIAGVLLLSVPAAVAGVDTSLVIWLGLFGVLVGIAVAVDLEQRRIPNRLTYGGTLGVLVVAAFAGIDAFVAATGGAALATLVVGLAWWFGRGSLGMGDVKFSSLVGGFVGVSGVVPYLLMGTAAGAVLALLLLALGRGRRATFAYGPALAFGAIASLYASSFSTAIG